MPAVMPGSASTFTAPASVVGSGGGSAFGHAGARIVWLMLAAPMTVGASVTFWRSSASTGGASPLLTITTAPCTTSEMYGPFGLNASGLYVGNIDSGSAIVWMH